MPGGGLFCLDSYGAQNVLLSGNPDFTWWYKNYKKYSHFAEESVTQPMDGPQDLFFDQPIQIRLKIPRLADLVRDLYFVFTLPDIYCKFIDLTVNTSRDCQQNFAWVNFIGAYIIQNCAFFIGGQKIQEFDGTYMIAKAQSDYDVDRFTKWSRLVGNVPELVDPANGEYAGGSLGVGYPLVFPDASGGNFNRPSIFGRDIQVPLPLWFTETTFESLPLIGLQYHEAEIQLTLRSIQELYRLLDPSGNVVRPGFKAFPTNPAQPMIIQYAQTQSLSGEDIRNFLTDWGTPAPLLNTWPLNPRIQMTYIYLTEEERQQFATQSLSYLVRQVTAYQFPSIFNRQFVELQTHNPINRLIIIGRRSDAIQYRNDIANFTNWINVKKSPFLASAKQYPQAYTDFQMTGQFVQQGQKEILRTLRVLGDGNELQEEKPIIYFNTVVPWKYLTGIPDSGLYVYPFGLSSPHNQPDGSVNSSRIRLFQVDLNPWPLPLVPSTSVPPYTYNVTIYVENLNWVEINSGMGGLKYAL